MDFRALSHPRLPEIGPHVTSQDPVRRANAAALTVGPTRRWQNAQMYEHLLTPSKITAWLDCAHYLTLRREVDEGTRSEPTAMFGEMAKMLLEKGNEHEQRVLAEYRALGRSVYEVPERHKGESFSAWVSRVGPALSLGHDVLYQMPFVHNGIRGIADFLERTTTADGSTIYEPVDAKLARQGAKVGHVLQLCFYAEAIAEQTGHLPENLHVHLGSGRRESVRTADVIAYWLRLRAQLTAVVSSGPLTETVAEPCAHCDFCEFRSTCEAQWRADDSLIYISGIRNADRVVLAARGVSTIGSLAQAADTSFGLDPPREERLVRQAKLQVQARDAPADPPPFELIEQAQTDQTLLADATTPTVKGFAALPEPDHGDIFLDYEGHPFWSAEAGLFFLFGWVERNVAGNWEYKAIWAHDADDEAAGVKSLVDYVRARRQDHPGMHVYHYNHTERSALVRLATDHGVAEIEVEELVNSGVFVDLFTVLTGAMQVGVESYGLKHVERLTDFTRGHDIDRGAGAVVEYERWMRDGNNTRLDRIARYNEDDVRATLALRDWLVSHRPTQVDWRAAFLESRGADEKLGQRIEQLCGYPLGSAEHLMGDLLSYWRRERRVLAAECLRLSSADEQDQFESPQVIAGLEFVGLEQRVTSKGNPGKWPSAVFKFPDQPISPDIGPGANLIVAKCEQEWAFFTLSSLNRIDRTLEVAWTDKHEEFGITPTALTFFANVSEKPKDAALCDLADRMIAGDTSSVGLAILRREPPKFLGGGGPHDGRFVGEHDAICGWVSQLDQSYLPIQGPPGTGKTFIGAQIIRALVRQGKRVGVTAMSHQAIDNLLQAVVDQWDEDDPTLRAVHKGMGGDVINVDYVSDNKRCANGDYDIVDGTPWLFASDAMRAKPVDVLVIDEAGQLGLADTLAATISASSVVLLGDPQQLPQVAMANHPNGAGLSALEHLLGPNERTFPPERGVLLDVTWRMHPTICQFISNVMYDGRLIAHPHCAQQGTAGGTGLRWIRAHHTGCSTESPQEAKLVAETAATLVGTDWTDQHGAVRPVAAKDIIVVAPYNDQRRLIRETLHDDPRTAAIEVGTVDKFQGREAAVVIFSMTTSSADLMPRDAGFLFSKNRLNVAISRARCVAHLICTEQLLDTRARSVEEMVLLSALCSFVEEATPL